MEKKLNDVNMKELTAEDMAKVFGGVTNGSEDPEKYTVQYVPDKNDTRDIKEIEKVEVYQLFNTI